MSRYSFPYQRALHSRLVHTTLKPVILIGLCVVLALPLVLSGVLAVRGGRQSAQIADAMAQKRQTCADALTALAGEEAVRAFALSGARSVEAYELLYAMRNAYAPGARFELVSLVGDARADDLKPGYEDFARRDALLLTRIRAGEQLVERVRVVKQSEMETPVVTLSVPVSEGGELIGCLTLLFTRAYLDALLTPARANVLLSADSGRVVYQSGALQSVLSERFAPAFELGPFFSFAGSLYVGAQARRAQSGMTVHVLFSFDFIYPVMLFSLLFFLALFCVMALLINRLSYQVATGPLMKPFDLLFTALQRYGEGDTFSRIPIREGSDAAPYLAQFNSVLDEVEKLLRRNQELERANALAELKTLESQFNPHFMFNMLDMIKYTIVEDQKQAVRMVLTLANMLRYTLDTGRPKVPVREDLKYLTDYLDMQSLRLGELFSYRIDCPDEALCCLIPKLIMQPLVENSVKYGFTGETAFHLLVRLSLLGERLVILVEDDGPGMDKKQVDALTASLQDDAPKTAHIGLYNTHRRLSLGFGEGAGLTLMSAPGRGTRVTLRLNAVGKGDGQHGDSACGGG